MIGSRTERSGAMQDRMEKEAGYGIGDIFVMKYQPKVRQRNINRRERSSFMLVQSGKYQYHSPQIHFSVESGDVVYLPQGASYEYKVLSKEAQCIQVEFGFSYSGKKDRTVNILPTDPVLLKREDVELAMLFHDLLKDYQSDEFMVLALICQLLSAVKNACQQKEFFSTAEHRILPAVKYIKEHFEQKIYVSHLAQLCDLSEAQFRREFRRYLGCSPIEYKNAILLREACNMLRSGNMNVTETAAALQFEDIYTFSQFFKKGMGISPREYMKKRYTSK